MQSATETVIAQLTSMPVGDLGALLTALERGGVTLSKRHVTRLLGEIFPGYPLRTFQDVRDFKNQKLNPLVAEAFNRESQRKRLRVWFGQLSSAGHQRFVVVSDRRGSIAWSRLKGPTAEHLREALLDLTPFLGEGVVLVPHGEMHRALGDISPISGLTVADFAHGALPFRNAPRPPVSGRETHRHLRTLEAESIRIIREAVAVAERPGMLFSMGKDSTVMWTLARKAFWPEPPPFPLLFVDTRWEHQDLYRFRDYIRQFPGTDLVAYTNPDAVARDVNPFDQGSALHTEITKTLALKQLLELKRHDFVFGGARRDEERSRAKERVFSIRNERHGWDPEGPKA